MLRESYKSKEITPKQTTMSMDHLKCRADTSCCHGFYMWMPFSEQNRQY